MRLHYRESFLALCCNQFTGWEIQPIAQIEQFLNPKHILPHIFFLQCIPVLLERKRASAPPHIDTTWAKNGKRKPDRNTSQAHSIIHSTISTDFYVLPLQRPGLVSLRLRRQNGKHFNRLQVNNWCLRETILSSCVCVCVQVERKEGKRRVLSLIWSGVGVSKYM